MAIMAIDYGKRRCGIAITDESENIIMPYKVLFYKSREGFLRQIKEIIDIIMPQEIVMGLPLNMDGSESDMSKEVRRLCARLEDVSGKKVVLCDERLTTFEAQQMLAEQGVSAKRQKDIIDMYAAYCLLRSFINEQREKIDDKKNTS